jgi:predicted PurR-regulated permease PerM
MNAGFFRRGFSSLVDITIILLLVTLTFVIGGKKILQNLVPNFDELYAAYTEIADAYQADLDALYEEYTVALELANGDETLAANALADYTTRKTVLDAQNSVDIEPYNEPLTSYFLNCIFYFAIGFMVLMSVYTVALSGKTLGRKLCQVKLESPSINPVSIFFHDIIFKYFFIVLIFAFSAGAGVVLFITMFLVDFVMLNFSPKKSTLRDILLKMSVVKTGYGY